MLISSYHENNNLPQVENLNSKTDSKNLSESRKVTEIKKEKYKKKRIKKETIASTDLVQDINYNTISDHDNNDFGSSLTSSNSFGNFIKRAITKCENNQIETLTVYGTDNKENIICSQHPDLKCSSLDVAQVGKTFTELTPEISSPVVMDPHSSSCNGTISVDISNDGSDTGYSSRCSTPPPRLNSRNLKTEKKNRGKSANRKNKVNFLPCPAELINFYNPLGQNDRRRLRTSCRSTDKEGFKSSQVNSTGSNKTNNSNQESSIFTEQTLCTKEAVTQVDDHSSLVDSVVEEVRHFDSVKDEKKEKLFNESAEIVEIPIQDNEKNSVEDKNLERFSGQCIDGGEILDKKDDLILSQCSNTSGGCEVLLNHKIEENILQYESSNSQSGSNSQAVQNLSLANSPALNPETESQKQANEGKNSLLKNCDKKDTVKQNKILGGQENGKKDAQTIVGVVYKDTKNIPANPTALSLTLNNCYQNSNSASRRNFQKTKPGCLNDDQRFNNLRQNGFRKFAPHNERKSIDQQFYDRSRLNNFQNNSFNYGQNYNDQMFSNVGNFRNNPDLSHDKAYFDVGNLRNNPNFNHNRPNHTVDNFRNNPNFNHIKPNYNIPLKNFMNRDQGQNNFNTNQLCKNFDFRPKNFVSNNNNNQGPYKNWNNFNNGQQRNDYNQHQRYGNSQPLIETHSWDFQNNRFYENDHLPNRYRRLEPNCPKQTQNKPHSHCTNFIAQNENHRNFPPTNHNNQDNFSMNGWKLKESYISDSCSNYSEENLYDFDNLVPSCYDGVDSENRPNIRQNCRDSRDQKQSFCQYVNPVNNCLPLGYGTRTNLYFQIDSSCDLRENIWKFKRRLSCPAGAFVRCEEDLGIFRKVNDNSYIPLLPSIQASLGSQKFEIRPPQLLENSEWDGLSKEVWQLYCNNRQLDSTFRKKMELRDTISRVIWNVLPMGRLFVVGSSLSGFGADCSDVDMCLMVTPRDLDQRTDAQAVLRLLQRELNGHGFVEKMDLITAKVPILKFTDQRTKIDVDLNCNNSVGIRNTHLLNAYSQLDWRVQPLVLTVKMWAQVHRINNAKDMTISSYSLVLMVIHYLQCGLQTPVLPCLHKAYPDKFSSMNHIFKLPVTERLPVFVSNNSQTLGELFYGFLDYYANKFKFTENAISIRCGAIFPTKKCQYAEAKKNDSRMWRYLCIEEPFDLTNTARSVYDEIVFEKVKLVFKNSFEILKKSKSLNEIME